MSLSQLVALIAPPACAACRAPLAVATALVCAACMRDLRWLGWAVCQRCGLPGHGGGTCPAARAPFRTAWAPLAHEGAARAIVRALKFDAALPLAGLMAAQIAANAPPWALGAAARGPLAARAAPADGPVRDRAVVAVPPARGRERRRGFDPAGRLAAELARRLDLPVAGCLRRSGRAPRQLGARRAQRRAPGRIVVEATRTPPRAVLLVDDVHTTGATLTACAAALRAAGALDVQALSYVRAL